MPSRVQRKRSAGWVTPLCGCGCGKKARYVGRPGRFGNPIRITPERGRYCTMYRVHGSPMDHHGGPAYCDLDTARHFAAQNFEYDLLNSRYPDYPSLDEIRAELAGHDVLCWCPPRPVNRNGSLGHINCHGDVLLDLCEAWANG